jgi:regulator of protease activity HflC (stomatin/prohibitin superfamily)
MENRDDKWFLVLILTVAIAVLGIIGATSLFEHIEAGQVAVFQSLDGTLSTVTDPGWKYSGFAKITKYNRSFQYWFTAPDQAGKEDERVKIRFNDGGEARIGGSIRVDLPLDEGHLLDLHRTYRSEIAVENELIRPVLEKSIYFTGPLLNSKESYSDKRSDMLSYIEDQASRGVYQTDAKTVETIDPLSKERRTVTAVELRKGPDGNVLRQEASPIVRFSVKLYNLSLNKIDYDKTVEDQIKVQQEAIMQVQTAIANSKRAEQDAITAKAQGEATAAKAKWEQETINAKTVAEATGKALVAEQSKKEAEFIKQREILLGQGEAERKKLVMEADGALEKKLATYEKVMIESARLLSESKQPLVPSVVMGGGSGVNTSVDQFIQLLGVKAAQDLGLDKAIQKK